MSAIPGALDLSVGLADNSDLNPYEVGGLRLIQTLSLKLPFVPRSTEKNEAATKFLFQLFQGLVDHSKMRCTRAELPRFLDPSGRLLGTLVRYYLIVGGNKMCPSVLKAPLGLITWCNGRTNYPCPRLQVPSSLHQDHQRDAWS